MALLSGSVQKSYDSQNENKFTLAFKTENASFQEGGDNFGIPLPNDSHKVDFSMKYSLMASHHNLAFVTYPKLKFDELTGSLTKK